MTPIKIRLALVFSFFISVCATAQIPTHIDPGQDESSKNIYEDPQYIVLVVALIALLVLFVIWSRRKK